MPRPQVSAWQITMCSATTVLVDADDGLDFRADLCEPEWVAPQRHGPAER
jgi:hypothetical protein